LSARSGTFRNVPSSSNLEDDRVAAEMTEALDLDRVASPPREDQFRSPDAQSGTDLLGFARGPSRQPQLVDQLRPVWPELKRITRVEVGATDEERILIVPAD
jgi:hypothetical protein